MIQKLAFYARSRGIYARYETYKLWLGDGPVAKAGKSWHPQHEEHPLRKRVHGSRSRPSCRPRDPLRLGKVRSRVDFVCAIKRLLGDNEGLTYRYSSHGGQY